MIRAVILDDEEHCTKTIEILLKELCPQVEIDAVFNLPIEAIQYLAHKKIDVLFLDIEMPFINGFELLNRLEPIDFKVVFTTAYDKFAIKAFKYSAFDYLLKPIDEAELVSTVNLLEKNFQGNQQLDLLMSMINNKTRKVDKIALPSNEGLEFVLIHEIVRCESDSNYTRLILINSKVLLVSRTLKEMTDLLVEFGFVRIHNSHLINPDHIKKYIKSGGGYLILHDGLEVPISRQKKDKVLSLLNSI